MPEIEIYPDPRSTSLVHIQDDKMMYNLQGAMDGQGSLGNLYITYPPMTQDLDNSEDFTSAPFLTFNFLITISQENN